MKLSAEHKPYNSMNPPRCRNCRGGGDSKLPIFLITEERDCGNKDYFQLCEPCIHRTRIAWSEDLSILTVPKVEKWLVALKYGENTYWFGRNDYGSSAKSASYKHEALRFPSRTEALAAAHAWTFLYPIWGTEVVSIEE